MRKAIISLSLFLFITLSITAQTDIKRKANYNVNKSGLAIEGFDPVSYIASNKAEKGKSAFTSAYKGVNYNFASAANRDAFKASPDTYEPAYGGWCAYAMGAKGEKVEIDPETFKVINGKTYLFYNFYFMNTLKDWNKNELGLKSKADLNWKKYN